MTLIRWDDDRTFEFVELLDFLIPEARWVEKQCGQTLDDLGFGDTGLARTLVSCRRHGIMLTWADAETWTLRDIDNRLVPDAAVPTTAGAEAGPATPEVEATGSVTSTTGGGSPSSRSSDSTPATLTD